MTPRPAERTCSRWSEGVRDDGHLPTDSAAFWFVMQIGFAATYPVKWWLIRRGIKDIM